MIAIQFGSAHNQLEGWINTQQHWPNGDITKPLQWDDNSVDFLLAEHTLEHVTPQQGYSFLKEAYRVLKKGGTIRVIVPDLPRVWCEFDDEYKGLLKVTLKDWYPAIGRPAPPPDYEPTAVDAIEHLVYCHGHQAIYCESLLMTLMEAAGLDSWSRKYGESPIPELNGVDGHHVNLGWKNCQTESCIVEGIKL